MTLVLDARQRAMLEEMGIKVWMPVDVPEPAPVAAPAAAQAVADAHESPARADEMMDAGGAFAPLDDFDDPGVSSARGARGGPGHAGEGRASTAPRPAPAPARAAPAPVKAPAAAPAQMSLRITAPERLYASEGQATTGGWLVVVDMPPAADGRHAGLLDGEAGRLLDQMLRALRLHAGSVPVHVQRLWRPSPGQAMTEGALDFDAAFEGGLEPLAPRMVLALGALSAQRLLSQQGPLGRLRGVLQQVPLGGASRAVVASYAPAYLLRNSPDKARAWADLCLAAEAVDACAPGTAEAPAS